MPWSAQARRPAKKSACDTGGWLRPGRVVELGTQVPVTIGAEQGGQVTVQPGDYLLADRSAVIFIAAADIERVLEAAELIVAKEAAMAKAILAGTPIGAVMGGNYEQMLEQ